tara:strand:- start:70513 stop:70623 length:111 start_codon:yes stop_codon:yes gene_type:complete
MHSLIEMNPIFVGYFHPVASNEKNVRKLLKSTTHST